MTDAQEPETASKGRKKRTSIDSYRTLPQHRTRAKLLRTCRNAAGRMMYVRRCKECGTEFETVSEQQDFCTKADGAIWTRRRLLRGLAIIDDAMRWRGNRKDKQAVADLCHKISIMLDEDRKAGRPSW